MKQSKLLAAVAATALMAGGAATAETVNWARAGDALTLDPHAQNEGPTHATNHQVYETLLHRDMAGEIIPSLATEWRVSEEDPNVWVFKLREGVKFHEGQDFTAEDVVFSLNRAKKPDSDMKELLASVKEVKAVGDHEVHIITDGPNPIIPSNLTNMFIMDKDWSEEHGVEDPQDFEGGEETYAVRNANGTGAYRLVSRAPDERTVYEANPDYWGNDQFPMDVSGIEFTPIQNAATRVAALLSGEVDFIQDVPVQDLERVKGAEGLVVRTAPQNRTIFFGLNVGAEDLESDNIEGENPFANKQVRQAMNMALNRDAIKQVVMRGQSQPTGVIMPPFVNGWTEELDTVPPYDVEQAKQLMEEAGYGDGFSVTLNCPNDRYINDEAICQAAVGMLAQIGIDVALDAKPKAQHFPLINTGETDFYMLGWGVPTFDSQYIFDYLVHTRTDEFGSWNNTGYSNPDLDEKIESLSSETDLEKRNQTIAEIWDVVQDDVIYLPIHHQVLNWGMKENVEFPVQPEDQPHFKFMEIEGSL